MTDTCQRRLAQCAEASRASGFDERYLRRLAAKGKVYTTLAEDGSRLFDLDELEARRDARANAKTADAQLDAQAVALFEAGVTPMDAVVQLGVTLSRVTTIYTAWRRLRAATSKENP